MASVTNSSFQSIDSRDELPLVVNSRRLRPDFHPSEYKMISTHTSSSVESQRSQGSMPEVVSKRSTGSVASLGSMPEVSKKQGYPSQTAAVLRQ